MLESVLPRGFPMFVLVLILKGTVTSFVKQLYNFLAVASQYSSKEKLDDIVFLTIGVGFQPVLLLTPIVEKISYVKLVDAI